MKGTQVWKEVHAATCPQARAVHVATPDHAANSHSAFRSWKRGVEQKGFYRREHGGWAEIYAETEIAREQGLKSE